MSDRADVHRFACERVLIAHLGWVELADDNHLTRHDGAVVFPTPDDVADGAFTWTNESVIYFDTRAVLAFGSDDELLDPEGPSDE